MKKNKNDFCNPNNANYHLYYESSFSPETFSNFNINEKHSLDSNLNTSRVHHFVKRLQSHYSLMPDEILPRLEKVLSRLHYGWCTQAMELIKGDLQLIKTEKSRSDLNDITLINLGSAIGKLLDTFEIAFGIEDIVIKAQKSKQTPHSGDYGNGQYQAFMCWTHQLIHPESFCDTVCDPSGALTISGTTAGPSVVKFVSPEEVVEPWQLFFDVLARAYMTAAYQVQENIETEKGNLACSHKPDVYSVLQFMREGGGPEFLAQLGAVSPVYQSTEDKEVEINMASLENHPFVSSDPNYHAAVSEQMKQLQEMLQIAFSLPESLQRRQEELLSELSSPRFPWPFRYLLLHHLAGDAFAYGFQGEDRVQYVEWLLDLFELCRFLTALALVSNKDYEKVVSNLRRSDNSLSQLLSNWEDFVPTRDRMRASCPERLNGLWSAFANRIRYHHLRPMVLRWRWCSHVKRPGRFVDMRYTQIDRELSLVRSILAEEDKDRKETVSTPALLPPAPPSDTSPAAPSAAAKKKKKKAVPSCSRLSPLESPLPFLFPDFEPDNFVPRRFATTTNGSDVLSTSSLLFTELDRLESLLPKQCGDASLAQELIERLSVFPAQAKWLFLQHLSKNPFPDQPFALVNLWKTVPPPALKEDKAHFLLLFLDWVLSLLELNIAWTRATFTSAPLGDLSPPDIPAIEGDQEPFPRMWFFSGGCGRAVVPEKMILDVVGGNCSGNGWLWVIRAARVGWKVVRLLADTDVLDLQCLVDKIKAARCEGSLEDLPLFDSTDARLARIEHQLSVASTGEHWSRVELGAKEQTIFLFENFLTKNWTTHPIVLEVMSEDIRKLPHALQFELLETLCCAKSRLEQEAIVLIVRHAVYESRRIGLDLLAAEEGPVAYDGVHTAQLNHPPPPLHPPHKPSLIPFPDVQQPLAAGDSHPPMPGLFDKGSLTEMLEAEDALAMPLTLPGVEHTRIERRLCTFLFECMVAVKMRFLEIVAADRWKHPHTETRDRISTDALKEELSTACAAARKLVRDFNEGDLEACGLDDSGFALSFAKHSGNDETKNLMLHQMWQSALGEYHSGSSTSSGFSSR